MRVASIDFSSGLYYNELIKMKWEELALKFKKKTLLLFLATLLLFAFSASIALAADTEVKAKFYSKDQDSNYKVTAIISPLGEGHDDLSYVSDVYLLVTRNGNVYERVYFPEHELTKNHTSSSATLYLTQSGNYDFTICMGNDNQQIGMSVSDSGNTPATYSLSISSMAALNPFSDVKNNAWYTDYICTAYSLGLINGMTATTYCPNETMTIAQAVVLATRINQLTTLGETIDYSDYTGKWYQPYFDYAIVQGFLDPTYESQWNQKATRSQFADIFANCVPDTYLTAIHNYNDGDIPDVKLSDTNGADIYKLYNAGILEGSDASHSFQPNSNIKRSEIAAIVVRMVVEEERLGYVPDGDEVV